MIVYEKINSISNRRKVLADAEKVDAINGDWKGADNCESIADMSTYIPNSELMRKANSEGVNAQVFYDFEDGRDDGRRVPVARMKGKDIAEISEAIKTEQKEMKGKINEAQKKAEAEARARASLEAYTKASQTHEEGK